MTSEQTPATGTGEVSADESYAAYEARFQAERGGDSADPSDVAEPVEDPADKTASESETEDDTDEQEPEGESKDGGTGERPKGKGGFQRKIDKLTGKIKELESKLAGAPAATSSESKDAKPELPKFEKPKPQLEDFDSIDEHTDALVDWKLEKAAFDKESTAKQNQAKAEATALIEKYQQGVSAAKKVHADYDRVMEAAKGVPIGPAHQRAILESEHGASIAYDLAKNSEELKKFAQMSPLAAARYIGKLEAALSGAPTRKPPHSTSAPRPPAHVGTRGAAVASDINDPAVANDYGAWERVRIAQLRKTGRK